MPDQDDMVRSLARSAVQRSNLDRLKKELPEFFRWNSAGGLESGRSGMTFHFSGRVQPSDRFVQIQLKYVSGYQEEDGTWLYFSCTSPFTGANKKINLNLRCDACVSCLVHDIKAFKYVMGVDDDRADEHRVVGAAVWALGQKMESSANNAEWCKLPRLGSSASGVLNELGDFLRYGGIR